MRYVKIKKTSNNEKRNSKSFRKTARKDYSSELSEGAWPCQHVISDEWLPEV